MATSAPRVLANDFKAQWAEIGVDVHAAVERVGASGWLVLGDEVSAFEAELARWWGVEHAVGVASGLDALEIALRVAGIGAGDRVVTTPFTAYATTLAIVRIGAEPVWVDVDATGGIDLDQARAAIAEDATIRALIPVHLYGHPLDPAALAGLVADTGVVLVEDCAQSAGAERDGRPTGVVGPLAATSLYPTKNLGAYGDGGVLLTSDAALAEHARRLRNYGQESHYHHVEIGLNSRLDELHAAILRTALLPRLDGWLARRAEVAERYAAALAGSPLQAVRPAGGRSANHLFPVLAPVGERERWTAALREQGVGVGAHYPFLCPDAPASEGRGRVVGDLATARDLAARELSLPLHPQLRDDDVEHVIAACASAADALT